MFEKNGLLSTEQQAIFLITPGKKTLWVGDTGLEPVTSTMST